MQIEATVDLSRIRDQTLRIRMDFRSAAARTDLVLPALAVGNGITVAGLRAALEDGRPLRPVIDRDRLQVEAGVFQLEYELHTRHTQCVGCDREWDLTYPFLNPREAFWGTGALAWPAGLEQTAAGDRFRFQAAGLPAGWRLFSNLAPGRMHAAVLEGFFAYASADQHPGQIDLHPAGRRVRFRWLAQPGKSIPLESAGLQRFLSSYLDWLQLHLGPLRPARIDFLVLQAPTGFERRTRGRTFASGENVIGGIAVYAPPDPAGLQALTGSDDYAFFLLDGLAHELMHFYTTTSWQGRFKSRLYPSQACPAWTARLLGEALNYYFSRQYVDAYLGRAQESLPGMLGRALTAARTGKGRSPLLELFLLDAALQRSGSSLLQWFGVLVRAGPKAAHRLDSAAELLEAAGALGTRLPEAIAGLLLDPAIPDYPAMLRPVLDELGFELELGTDGLARIRPVRPARRSFRRIGIEDPV